MRYPVRRGAADSEGVLKVVVKSFNEAVGLRVEGCGGDVRDVEEMGKAVPEGGHKLRTTIRSDGVRKAKAGNPSRAKSFSTGSSGR